MIYFFLPNLEPWGQKRTSAYTGCLKYTLDGALDKEEAISSRDPDNRQLHVSTVSLKTALRP